MENPEDERRKRGLLRFGVQRITLEQAVTHQSQRENRTVPVPQCDACYEPFDGSYIIAFQAACFCAKCIGAPSAPEPRKSRG